MTPHSPAFVSRPGRPALDAAVYDFARPRAVSTRHMRALDAAHERLADELAATLTLAIGEPVGVRAASTVEVLAADVLNSQAAEAVVFQSRLGAAGPVLMLSLEADWAAFLVQRHFGGDDPLDALTEARTASALERSVLERRWLPLIGVAFADAWGSVPPVADPPGTGPPDLGPPTGPVIVLDLELTVGEGQSRMTVAYPAATVRMLLDRPQASDPSSATPSADAAAFSGVPVDLQVELGRIRVPVGDLLALEPGDIIPIGVAPGSPLTVRSGSRARFEARVGVQGRRLAIEILSVSDSLSTP